ncbi:MAG: 3'-5' exonuclease [Sarcina sp.]
MALLKKCNHCNEKGLFLKLTNGLCDKCKLIVDNLEKDYRNLLQDIALNPNNKTSIIKNLNILITKSIPFDGISNISISTYNDLLLKLSENNLKKTDLKKDLNKPSNQESFDKIDSVNDIKLSCEPSDIKLSHTTLTMPTAFNSETILYNENTNQSKKKFDADIVDIKTNTQTLKVKNLIEPIVLDENPKNASTNFFIEKQVPKTLNLKLNTTNSLLEKKSSIINLNLQSLSSKQEIQNKIENSTQSSLDCISIKETFAINTLKKKCSTIISKIDDSNSSLEFIAENYFHIKTNILPNLNINSDILNKYPDIFNNLETIKNTLCIRSKKSEDELFDFFNYVTIFIQTTGLSPKNSDIIEISATKISYGKIIDEFYSLVNPIKSIKLSVTNSTGISNKDVENQPTIDLILPSLMDFISDYQLVAFNAKPVDSFINSTLQDLNMKVIAKPLISSMNLYRIRYKNFHGHPPALSDISSTCLDLLSSSDIDYINKFESFSTSSAHAIYKLFEILKYRYK